MEKKNMVVLKLVSVAGIAANVFAGLLMGVMLMQIPRNFMEGVDSRVLGFMIVTIIASSAAVVNVIQSIALLRKKATEAEHVGYHMSLTAATTVMAVMTVIGMVMFEAVAFAWVPVVTGVLSAVQCALLAKEYKKLPTMKLTSSAKAAASAMLIVPMLVFGISSGSSAHAMYVKGNDNYTVMADLLKDFQSTCTDGSTITSEDLQGHKLVFINMWGTGCGPCKAELPALGEVARKYADKDVMFVGVCCDATTAGKVDEDTVAYANQLCADADVDYPSIVPVDETMANFRNCVAAIPTTVIVDENGQVLDIILGGNDVDGWSEVIDSYLD